MHGKGLYRLANSAEYEGEFRDDKMQGKGVIRLPDGTISEGEWANETIIPENEQEFDQVRTRCWKMNNLLPNNNNNSPSTTTTNQPHSARESA